MGLLGAAHAVSESFLPGLLEAWNPCYSFHISKVPLPPAASSCPPHVATVTVQPMGYPGPDHHSETPEASLSVGKAVLCIMNAG